MPILANAKHELFSQLVASGKSEMSAFAEAGYSARSAKQNAHRLSENEGIKARIAELKGRTAEKCEATRAEVLKFLVGVVRAKPSEAGFENPLCESVITKAGPTAAFPSKLGALAQLAKMCGWNEPEKVQVGMEAELVAVIAKIRGQGRQRSDPNAS
ncbi:MAG TPA: terminase small subunit [Terrimicrobiaceae bacterium]